jgi:hypothetical protein
MRASRASYSGAMANIAREKDFENWLTGLGDLEIAKKMCILKNQSLTGEELR